MNVSPFYYCMHPNDSTSIHDRSSPGGPIPEVDHHQNQLEDRLVFTVFTVFFRFVIFYRSSFHKTCPLKAPFPASIIKDAGRKVTLSSLGCKVFLEIRNGQLGPS